MKKDLVLVVGASGTVGSELVKLIGQKGFRVRATTSKVVKSGQSDLFQINLATGEGVKAAFEGVDRAFLLSPPGYADQYATLSPLVQEAKRKGLKKVVLMTAMGADAVETSPFRRVELELEKSGISYNIIRPNWFLQNFNTFWIQGIREQGKILVPGGSAKVSFIDARDIAAVAAELLTNDKHSNKAFDLTGSESVDHATVAQALAKATGKPIQYQDISPETFRQALLSAGLPADYVSFLLMIFGFLREGYSARKTDHVKQITGKDPINLNQYAADFKQAWL